MITLTTIEIIIRLAIAVGLGALIGLERTLAGKTAGLRTYAMVSLSSSLFVIISQIVSSNMNGSFDPLRMASQVIAGIGFIGAGLVIFKDRKITGITTAAGLWVSAGVGMASGFGLYSVSITATVFVMLIFTIMWFVESFLKRFSYKIESSEDEPRKTIF
ncbi:MAG: MgtC/SapB family protein [Candidatus Pacebacteria bacterium]|nr:MgtC/SapB family protein [Candidatus Paceibacterota bacterium]